MKQKAILIIAIVALVSLMIAPVCAETITQTVGQSTYSSQNYFLASGLAETATFSNVRIENIEYSGGATALVHTDDQEHCTFDVDAPLSAQTSFNMTIGSTIIATGDFGYQRLFTALGAETNGYQWLVFDTYDVSSFSGNQVANINMNHNLVYNITSPRKTMGSITGQTSPSDMYFDYTDPGAGFRFQGGYYTFNRNNPFSNTYSVTYPSGLGITGNVVKNVGGQNYSSRAYVVNSSGATLANEDTANTDPWSFALLYQPISIRIQDSSLNWYNSSILFTPTAPTVTPTPAPTVAPGYVRNTFVTIDGTTYSTIHGSNIMLYDVEAGVWSNSTSDADGSFYIDTLPYHTINAYATFTVFEDHYADASIMGAETGYSGMDYPIYMYPPGLSPGPGNINLYITVVDADTTYAIGSANVQVELPTVAITGDITGSGGSAATFVVPNNTIIKARATKSGYGAVTESFNSGEISPKTKTLSMRKLLVTIAPTRTIPPGGVTPAITVIPGCEDPNSAGCSRVQDAAMMKQLRDAGPSLIGLCIIVMFMGLVKLLGK